MAVTLKGQILVDTNKRTYAKFVVLGDGTQLANTVLLDVSNLAYALNANGYIMSSNTHPKSTYRTTISRIKGYSNFNGAGYIALKWHGDSNSEIVVVGGQSSFDFLESSGGTAVSTIPNPEANSSGDILITTVGMSSNDTFTLFLEVKKYGEDYDQGQTADPAAFNKGAWA